MAGKRRLVVVGNGMAGARLVEEILARGGNEDFEIAMFGDEPYGNYNRILLSGVLSGTHDAKEIFINPLEWYAENGITLHAGTRVSRIDRAARYVYAGAEVALAYDDLVIATGGAPFIPPLDGVRDAAGALRSGVFVFRTLDDCEAIMRPAEHTRRAAVIGGGLLGLEAARGLLNLGLEAHVVHLMPHLMEVQLDPMAGAVL